MRKSDVTIYDKYLFSGLQFTYYTTLSIGNVLSQIHVYSLLLKLKYFMIFPH